jgi:hypothetical protein
LRPSRGSEGGGKARDNGTATDKGAE